MANPEEPELEKPVWFNSKFSVAKVHEMQRRLARRVIRKDRLPKEIRLVAGVDVAYIEKISVGVATTLNYDSLTLVESQIVHVKIQFPYIPTLLSLREIPPTLSAVRKLETQPDVFLVDGQGIAHPCRLGFASHLGLIIGKPTIGVAKSILCGKVEKMTGGGWAQLIDKGETVGAAVVTKPGRKPLYVSIGHKISLERAVEIVKHCIRTRRIPEPVLTAHKMADEEKRRIQKEGREGSII